MEQKKKKKLGIFVVILLVVGIALFYYFFILSPSLKFQEQERLVEKAGKRYFEQNAYLLPKEGVVREVSLSTLYEKKYVDTLYAPNSKKLCSGKNSFVKIKNEEGKYQYYTYLECDSYRSSMDHEGPQIVLNGKETVTIARTGKYKEEGVKSVRDNQDGLMDVKTVEIDSSKVNTEKAGTYEVTYTAYDNLNNKTVKVRTVKVVEKLATTIKNATDKKGYYQGDVENNYLLFNAMLFRIVGLDADGNITIVSNELLANVDYSLKGQKVSGSTMEKWLNDYFYEKLSQKSKSYLVTDGNWCIDTIDPNQLNKTDCEQTAKMKVGLISVEEFNRSLENYSSYLGTTAIVQWLSNPSSEKGKVWTQRNNFIYDKGAQYASYEDTILFGVKPALKLKKNVEVVAGDGSLENPFFLGDYEKAKTRTALHERLTGEFVTYSGYLFRIVDQDKEGNTHVISDGVLTNDGVAVEIKYEDGKETSIYNPTKKGNLGYKISNEMTQYINTDYFVKKNVTVPIYKDRALYQKEESKKTYPVKIAAPNTFDLFSAKRENGILKGFWYINSSKNAIRVYIASAGGTIYYTDYVDTSEKGVKISAYITKDAKITGGSGTEEDPYKIKK